MPEDFARLVHGRRSGRGRWRAKCPVHKSRGLTLAIYSDKDRVGINCFAGCSKDDVLAALGLTWKDTLYEDKTLTAAEKREWARKKAAEEQQQRQARIADLNMFLKAIIRPRRPVTIFDLQHACFDARMESYFKEMK